ncbi:MAG: hypothetical protein ABMB14_08885, partial [Myxococcota bacterium]
MDDLRRSLKHPWIRVAAFAVAMAVVDAAWTAAVVAGAIQPSGWGGCAVNVLAFAAVVFVMSLPTEAGPVEGAAIDRAVTGLRVVGVATVLAAFAFGAGADNGSWTQRTSFDLFNVGWWTFGASVVVE